MTSSARNRREVGIVGLIYKRLRWGCARGDLVLRFGREIAGTVPVSLAEGKRVTTIEGLAQNGTLHKVQKAWIENDVPQCGYCQSGMIMAVAALLKDKPKPTDADINREITNICRCGTYQQVREAIHAAAFCEALARFAYICAVPPSTNSSIPVTKLESSDARKSAAAAISCG